MISRIKEAILESLPSAEVHVFDPDGQHFEVIVVSDDFEGVSLLKQHRMVMNALKIRLESDVHSVFLKTFTGAQWELNRVQYDSFLSKLS